MLKIFANALAYCNQDHKNNWMCRKDLVDDEHFGILKSSCWSPHRIFASCQEFVQALRALGVKLTDVLETFSSQEPFYRFFNLGIEIRGGGKKGKREKGKKGKRGGSMGCDKVVSWVNFDPIHTAGVTPQAA